MTLPKNIQLAVYRNNSVDINVIVAVFTPGKRMPSETFETTITPRGRIYLHYFERDVRKLTNKVEHHFEGRPTSGSLSDHYNEVSRILVNAAKEKFEAMGFRLT